MPLTRLALLVVFFAVSADTGFPRSPADGGAFDLRLARAHWVSADLIAWSKPAPDVSKLTFELAASAEGGLAAARGGVSGGRTYALTLVPQGLPEDLRLRFPHLAGALALRLPPDAKADAAGLLRGQLAVSARRGAELVAATSLQVPGVIDDLFRYDGRLGPQVDEAGVTLRVWAPTARSVALLLFDGPRTAEPVQRLEMKPGPAGTWQASGPRAWLGRYYLYEVEVYTPSTGRVERTLSTDPYSLALARNGTRSQVVDLADPALAPPGWATLAKPALASFADVVLYELHVRDFSASDPQVPAELKGTFKAFTLQGTHGARHLRGLAEAGLTHVHLLPSFDFATVDEDRSTWKEPAGDLSSWPPDSDRQQAAVKAVAAEDGFNWGYDPAHYTVPEGSYATDPDGGARTREFREMVAALSRAGLRVVMDVVYNHTHASGLAPHSVLDRVVPGYYHRLDADGRVEHSTCCENTASEHAMMEKLMVDSLVTWARHYKVDGFRFDLMGHHLKSNLLAVRRALDALTPEQDGVDGKRILLYGEGWDFGEVAANRRGVNATQLNLAGTGIATFSDRLRDAARGGSAFGPAHEQGFLTGLVDAPNAEEKRGERERRELMLLLSDRIRVGLAGHVSSVQLQGAAGRLVSGREVDYGGGPAGYAQSPLEAVTYVEAHDNETLFDAIQMKAAAEVPLDERVRMQRLGLALVALGQGLPFFHAGQELLRSKSLDRNSFDSGDWFNRLDFTYAGSNWGVGLPPEKENGKHWPLLKPLLADPALRPTPAHIRGTLECFLELLRIRRSSALFRLGSADAIDRHLRFLNTGPAQEAGLIVMLLEDPEGRVDRAHPRLVVAFNGLGRTVTWREESLAAAALELHPELAGSADARTRESRFERGTLTLSPRTAAVFWTPASAP